MDFKHWLIKLAEEANPGDVENLKQHLGISDFDRAWHKIHDNIVSIDEFEPVSTDIKSDSACREYQKQIVNDMKRRGFKYISRHYPNPTDYVDVGELEYYFDFSIDESNWYGSLYVHYYGPLNIERIDHDARNMGPEEQEEWDRFKKDIPCTFVGIYGKTETDKMFK